MPTGAACDARIAEIWALRAWSCACSWAICASWAASGWPWTAGAGTGAGAGAVVTGSGTVAGCAFAGCKKPGRLVGP
jgi:hypothetical protein